MPRFFRNGDFIYISPEWGNPLDIGERVNLNVAENTDIVSSLIRHLVFRRFRDTFTGRIPDSFSPLKFSSQKKEHNIIHDILPQELKDKLSYARTIEVDVRYFIANKTPLFGIVINIQNRWSFSESLLEIKETGFQIIGCTALESIPIPGLDGILAPNENVLGVVTKIHNNFATIDTNSGLIERQLDQLTLQRTRSQIGDYLNHRIGENLTKQIFTHIESHKIELAKSSIFFNEVFQIANWFSKQNYLNSDGFSFSITTDSSLNDQTNFTLQQTRLVFDIAPGASASTPLRGLTNFGPYDSKRFDRKTPRILAIFQESSRGAATQFLARMKDGIPSSRYFKKGLRDLFQLNDIHYTPITVSSSEPASYERAIDEAIMAAGTNEFDLAIVEFVDDSEQFPSGQNPYLRAKSHLMNLGITVQGVRESHLRESEQFQSNTLGPLSLQIYAKLGGTPWLLPGSQSVDHELIIGVGNSLIRKNFWSGTEQSRIVGLTTFFLGDGRYALGEELPSVSYDQYFKTLLDSLDKSITRLSEEYSWKENDTVRLVFHVFKPLKNIEIDVIDQLVKKLQKYNIRYAFVTISTKHPWQIYKSTSSLNAEKTKWNVIGCNRGDNLVINNKSCLLQLRGLNDRTNRKHRSPKPVLIRIHEKSTYQDLQFIVQQIHDFSFLSWRGFFPIDLPVTIDYANKMAKLSSKLEQVESWNTVSLARYFRKKKWFL